MVLSVIIPVYNEEKTIREIVHKVRAVKIPKEIVIVDDGSKDGSVEFVEKFVKECKKLAIENMELMNKDFTRLGVWMDFENAYMPIVPESIESIWWLIKKVHEQKRLYEGFRTMTWCASCETALAKHELNYKEVKDHSIFLKFKIKDKSNDYLIVWTTTPWTLPGNVALAVGADITYVRTEQNGEWLILAKENLGIIGKYR